MPIFVDRHDMHGLSHHDIAEAHRQDLEAQKKYGVKFMTYWHDEERGNGFCLIDAPSRDVAMRVHAETHGNVAIDIIEVDLSTVMAFLGRITDPIGLGDNGTPPIDSAFKAVMFTDIVGSTEMTARLGDLESVDVIRAHDGVVRQALRDFNGREVKHLGDGIMASFDTIPSSLEAALSITEEVATLSKSSAEKMQLRIGIDAGEPIEDSRDLFGATVQLAARLCAAAMPDTILVSEAVSEASGLVDTRDGGTRQLKGFKQPVQVYEVFAP